MPSTRRFEGRDLDAVLARVHAEVGDTGTIVRAERVRRGGLAGFFSRETFEVEVEMDDGAGRDTCLPLLALADRVSDDERADTGGARFDAILERAVRDRAPGVDVGTTVTLEPREPAPAAPVPPRGAVTAAVEAPPGVAGHADGWELVGPRPMEAPVAAAERDPRGTLLARLAGLPAAPQVGRDTGEVVAVVGELDQALPVAAHLQRGAGLPARRVDAVATRRPDRGIERTLVVDDPAIADARRRSWRRRSRPTFVVVDTRIAGRDGDWARRMLEALEPSLVWGVVDATRKNADIEAWAGHLGGLDALAVLDAGTAAAPAEILDLGIPVGLLDGEAATAERWADLLAQGLAP